MFSFTGKTQEKDFTKDSLKIVSGFMGQNVFVIGDSVVYKNTFQDVIKSNSQSYEYFRKGNNQNILAATIGFIGGGAIGFTLGSLISGGDPYWGVGAAGLGLLIINYPISQSSKYNFKKATDKYNRTLNNDSSFWNRSELNLSYSGTSLTINLKF
jgi:hypothetical protein